MKIHSCLAQLRAHLESARYTSKVADRYLAVASYFLRFLEKNHVPLESALPDHVHAYLREALRLYRRIHGRRPPIEAQWRLSHTSGIHMLLRLVQGRWPPEPVPASSIQEFHTQLCSSYAQWLREFRGLADETIAGHQGMASRLLNWLGERAASSKLAELTIRDIDSFVAAQPTTLRRPTRKSQALYLRSFLRYLHGRGLLQRDLSAAVIAPRVYALENIPSTLSAEDIAAVLKNVRQDRSPSGRRDLAILTLLATYGLRAGEITHSAWMISTGGANKCVSGIPRPAIRHGFRWFSLSVRLSWITSKRADPRSRPERFSFASARHIDRFRAGQVCIPGSSGVCRRLA